MGMGARRGPGRCSSVRGGMIRYVATLSVVALALPAVAEEAVVRLVTDRADPVIERVTGTSGDGTVVSFETYRQSVTVTLTHLNDAPMSDAEWAEVHERVHVCEQGELVNLSAQTLDTGVRWFFDCIWAAPE